MQESRGAGAEEAAHVRRSGRLYKAAIAVAVCGAASLFLYLHGSSLWYAPLGAMAIILAHVVVLGVVALIVTRFVGGRFHGEDAAARQGGSLLLHKPRQYDLLVRMISFGREDRLRQWMLDLAGLKAGDSVLDVGCGTGTLLLAAADRLGPSGTLQGVEPSPEMIAEARRKAGERGIPLDIKEASADALPHQTGSFDAVFCTLVLHHMPPEVQEGAIREMRRVLRPGGRAVIVDWQRPKLFFGAITSGLLLVHIMHTFVSGVPLLDSPVLEPMLKRLGFEDVSRSSFRNGVIGAAVCRLGDGTAAKGRDEA